MNYNPWTNNITHGNMKFVKIDGWKNNCHHAWYFIHLLGEFYHSGDIRMTVVETVEHFFVYLSGYEIYSLYVPDVIFWWVCFKYYFVILISIIGFSGCVNTLWFYFLTCAQLIRCCRLFWIHTQVNTLSCTDFSFLWTKMNNREQYQCFAW